MAQMAEQTRPGLLYSDMRAGVPRKDQPSVAQTVIDG